MYSARSRCSSRREPSTLARLRPPSAVRDSIPNAASARRPRTKTSSLPRGVCSVSNVSTSCSIRDGTGRNPRSRYSASSRDWSSSMFLPRQRQRTASRASSSASVSARRFRRSSVLIRPPGDGRVPHCGREDGGRSVPPLLFHRDNWRTHRRRARSSVPPDVASSERTRRASSYCPAAVRSAASTAWRSSAGTAWDDPLSVVSLRNTVGSVVAAAMPRLSNPITTSSCASSTRCCRCADANCSKLSTARAESNSCSRMTQLGSLRTTPEYALPISAIVMFRAGI